MFSTYLHKNTYIHICLSILLIVSVLFSNTHIFVYAQEMVEGDSGIENISDQDEAVNEDSINEQNENNNQDTIIETGDVIADTDVVQEVNTTETNALVSTTTGGGVVLETEAATGTENGLTGEYQLEVSVISSSTANIETEAESDAQTGNNTASENENSVVITGEAHASANVVNMANTNIVNSDGFVMLLGTLSNSMDVRDLDIWERSDDTTSDENTCDNTICGTSYVFVDNNNSSSITNNIVVEASSGNNTVSDNSGDGLILTGEAHASANVVNMANTNIVNSNYLIFSANHFGNLDGDFLFPSAEEIADLFYNDSAYSSPAVINTNNTAYVENNVSTDSNTGSNNTQGDNGSVILTGDAESNTNVINQINQNYINTDQFLFVFKVHGSWEGSVLGLPEGFVFDRGANGGSISSSVQDSGVNMNNSTTYEINTNNTAYVENNIVVSADTGNNTSENNNFSGISTGNAYAGANVVNVVNSNILGRNWILAVINIFGDWTGDVSFGQTDLWIAGQADTNGKEFPEVGDSIIYHYTVINNSDTTAPNVHVVDVYDEYLRFVSSTNGVQDGNSVVWELGDINPGESVEVEYVARVKNSIPWAYTILENDATVSADMSDANYADNNEIVRVTGYKQPHVFYSGSINETQEATTSNDVDEYITVDTSSTGYVLTEVPEFHLTKSHNMPNTIQASTTVTYEIDIKNEGGEAYYAMLFDTIKDQDGNILYEQYWPLDTVFPDEEIVVEYDVFFNENTPNATYTNYAHVEAMGKYNSLTSPLAIKIDSDFVSSVITVDSDMRQIIPALSDDEKIITPVSTTEIHREKPDKSILISVSGDDMSGFSELRNHIVGTMGSIGLFDNNIGLFGLSGDSGVRDILKTSQQKNQQKKQSGLNASVLNAFSNLWISRYSWILLLIILGMISVVLVRRRNYVQE